MASFFCECEKGVFVNHHDYLGRLLNAKGPRELAVISSHNGIRVFLLKVLVQKLAVLYDSGKNVAQNHADRNNVVGVCPVAITPC
jgi:hypothetical protein